MKKISLALLYFLSIYGEEVKFLGRIVRQAKIPKEIITKERLDQDNTMRFKRYLESFSGVYNPLYNLLKNLDEALKQYSTQSLDYQRQYSNIGHIDAFINQIRQKDLTIALTRLLHYRASNPNPDHQPANEMIENLRKIIASIEKTLNKLASNQQLLITFSDTTPEKIAHVTVADYFKHYLGKRLFFKIKKIKRSIGNWDHKRY
jgi:hypothetical protein